MIRIAKIINTRGLKGECKVMLFTDQDDLRFQKGNPLYLKDGKKLIVENYSVYKGFGYVRFEGITTLEQAEALKNEELYLPPEELTELEEDEYYYHELNGCEVYTEEGEDTGKVVDILETGANLVLRVRSQSGQYLLPFVNAFVLDVDPKEKKIVIRDMDGLR
ncbi:ribosome maturation factor RimM [Allobaculum mucilyticum]|uniref:ribosome maturation factor RimM n=1 Tax=Allobaculum mucilyticum TaxID=2834459 RepID=UPI001E596D51|nr:ribosome maturation factor RimM [Allobaculum mucilyticum]UNT95709.1 ribosome maturation factor RimM [Allobaculum mucilyticum]